ncbi:MAG: hypothetical protein K8T89_16720 [Planctomycetes bacterium]|nr:hypothetical protein [Planctomycetota bacterium]
MQTTLTAEQSRAIAENPDEPLRLIDPATNGSFVVISSEKYEQVKSLLAKEFQPSEAYPAIDRAFADGWDAPGMDDYDR